MFLRLQETLTSLLFLLPILSTADLTYTDPTTNCENKDVNGRAVYCCNGLCFDGTTIQDTDGQCGGFNSACADPVTIPSCAANQVYTNIKDTTIDAGLGACYVTGCTWARDIYTYSCCDCPAGFYGFHSSCDGPGGRYITFCVGCDGAGENLSYDANNGGYSCAVGPGTTVSSTATSVAPIATVSAGECAFLQNLNTLNSYASLLSTLGGGLCKVTSPGGAAVSLFSAAFSAAIGLLDPTKGLTGNSVSAGTAVVVAGAVLAGLPEEIGGLALVGGVVEAVSAFCNLNTAVGLVLTYVGEAESRFLRQNCPTSPTVARRFAEIGGSMEIAGPHVTEGMEPSWPLAPRAVSNPCAELLALFPTNYSIPATEQDACNEILALSTAGISDAGLLNATTSLQHACTSINNFTFLVHFVDFLDAVKAAIPYCDVSTSTSTSSSSNPPSLSTTSRSTKTSSLKGSEGHTSHFTKTSSLKGSKGHTSHSLETSSPKESKGHTSQSIKTSSSKGSKGHTSHSIETSSSKGSKGQTSHSIETSSSKASKGYKHSTSTTCTIHYTSHH